MQYKLSTMIWLMAVVSCSLGGYLIGQMSSESSHDGRTIVSEFEYDLCSDVLHSMSGSEISKEDLARDFFRLVDSSFFHGHHGKALSSLVEVDVNELIKADASVRFIGVYESDVLAGGDELPTLVYVNEPYDDAKDWCFPKSGYNFQSSIWRHCTRMFAEKFNRIRLESMEDSRPSIKKPSEFME